MSIFFKNKISLWIGSPLLCLLLSRSPPRARSNPTSFQLHKGWLPVLLSPFASLPKCICAAICLLCYFFTFALPFGGRSGFLLTAQEPKKIAGPRRIQFGVCFKVFLSASCWVFSFFHCSPLLFFCCADVDVFLCLCEAEDDSSVCLVSAARSFFWSCALWLNVSCLLEVFAIAVGLFLYYRVGSWSNNL